ncbi:hypothetical protein [Halomonas mongoliensis]|uniref:hypothetical protein n=1 Tax=Halomonas mongoliensis TaxID=321265 RepID=UPI00403AB88B
MKIRAHHYLLKALRRGRVLKKFIKDELRQQNRNVKLTDRISCFVRGFNSNKAELFDFKGRGYSSFYSDFERNKVRKFNKVHGLLLDRKDIFHSQMARLGLGPKVVGTIVDGRFYKHGSSEAKDSDELYFECRGNALVRPVKRTGLRRTLRYIHEEDGFREIRELGKSSERSVPIENLMKGHWQVLEGVQGESLGVSDSIVPVEADPVLRVTTLKSSLTGEIKPIFSFIACSSSERKDYIEVELERGVLTEKISVDNEGKLSRLELVEEVISLAGYDEAVKQALYAHHSFPNLNAVSWWLVKSHGGWLMINGTNKLDTHVVQAYRPCKDVFKKAGWDND